MPKFLTALILILFSRELCRRNLCHNEAFALKALAAENELTLSWTLAPGYYLYHDQLAFNASKNKFNWAVLSLKGSKNRFHTRGVSVYIDKLKIIIPLEQAEKGL